MQEFTVTFNPQGKSIRVARGSDLLTAAIKAGIALAVNCGGEGLCGKCKVLVKSGKVKSEPSRFITGEEFKNGVVLACQTIVEGDLNIDIPSASVETHVKISHEAEEFTKGIVLKRENFFKFSPLIKKIYLELPKPTADDNISDLERVTRELEKSMDSSLIGTRLASIKHLGDVLRENDFCVTAVIGYHNGAREILAIEPGDTSEKNFGFAFDIGTTTVVGQLIDLNTRDVLGTRIAFNKQASFGSDVITRIIYASEPEGLGRLNEAVLENIEEMIEDLTVSSGVNLGDVYAVTCAGNMTMMHLLLKIDPSNIRRAPYIPTATVFPTVHSSGLGIEVNPKGIAAFLPGVCTYIGGDIVAGILACGLSDQEDTSLLADIGTNGEIVLGNKDWMMGAAASAGPAFEGSGLNCGMKAVKGAIQKVTIDKGLKVAFDVIGAGKPKGICGSGYIDLLRQMLKNKIMGRDGRINRDIKSKRVRKSEAGYEFVIAFKEESDSGNKIVIRDDDIENLKRSKAAIYSAIMSLLAKVEKKIYDVKKIYIAGGFGNYLNIENAIFIGLLPDADRKIYEFVGNSSLAGARMALLSHEAAERAGEIYKNITYLDLSSEPNYMDEYVASLFFPHTDLGRFPSVKW